MQDILLFVCLGNSCRSIMAEALTRQIFPEVKVASAGMNPLGFIAEETLQVLAELGIALEGLWSKGLSDVNLSEFNLMVNLTSYPLDSLVPRAFQGKIVSYPVPDPFAHSMEVYREARDTIRLFITKELPQHFSNIQSSAK